MCWGLVGRPVFGGRAGRDEGRAAAGAKKVSLNCQNELAGGVYLVNMRNCGAKRGVGAELLKKVSTDCQIELAGGVYLVNMRNCGAKRGSGAELLKKVSLDCQIELAGGVYLVNMQSSGARTGSSAELLKKLKRGCPIVASRKVLFIDARLESKWQREYSPTLGKVNVKEANEQNEAQMLPPAGHAPRALRGWMLALETATRFGRQHGRL